MFTGTGDVRPCPWSTLVDTMQVRSEPTGRADDPRLEATMIDKNHKHRGRGVKVTFSIPIEWLDEKVSVVGDFNDWDPTANPLRKKGAVRTASVVLEPGREYAFRYLDARGYWFDDPAADAIRDGSHGGTNGIIDLRTAEPV